MTSISLIDEVIKELENASVRQDIIDFIKNDPDYLKSKEMSSQGQRIVLISLLFRLLMRFKNYVPPEIRVYLNEDNDPIEWLNKIKITVLPFIIENQGLWS